MCSVHPTHFAAVNYRESVCDQIRGYVSKRIQPHTQVSMRKDSLSQGKDAAYSQERAPSSPSCGARVPLIEFTKMFLRSAQDGFVRLGRARRWVWRLGYTSREA